MVYIIAIGSSVIATLFAAFVTYYFSTKNNTIKMQKIAKEEIINSQEGTTSRAYEIVRKELKESIILHNREKHQMDISLELKRHEKECGDNLRISLSGLGTSLHKMELRQSKMNMKMNLVTNIMSKIAEKMQITITPDMIETGDNDE